MLPIICFENGALASPTPVINTWMPPKTIASTPITTGVFRMPRKYAVLSFREI